MPFEVKGRDWRLGYIFSSCTIVCSILVVTTGTYVDEPSHPCRRQVLHLMTQWRRQACCRQVLHTVAPIYGGAGSSSHACWCWIKGGATGTVGEVAWDVSVFRHLLQGSNGIWLSRCWELDKRDGGRAVFNEEYVHSGGNIRSSTRLCRCALVLFPCKRCLTQTRL
jgi:hypothetical protein